MKYQQFNLLISINVLTPEFFFKGLKSFCVLPHQPLNFEIKPSYTLKVEGANTHLDPAFRHRGPFKDVTIVHVSIEDVDEPPLFDSPAYYVELPEDAEIGTMVKTVSARDPDVANNTVRWGWQINHSRFCVLQ